MDLLEAFSQRSFILMEGALGGERLKLEYGLAFDEDVVMAGHGTDALAGSMMLRLLNGLLALDKRRRCCVFYPPACFIGLWIVLRSRDSAVSSPVRAGSPEPAGNLAGRHGVLACLGKGT